MNPSMKAIVSTLTMLDIYMCYTHHDFFYLNNLLQAQRKKEWILVSWLLRRSRSTLSSKTDPFKTGNPIMVTLVRDQMLHIVSALFTKTRLIFSLLGNYNL